MISCKNIRKCFLFIKIRTFLEMSDRSYHIKLSHISLPKASPYGITQNVDLINLTLYKMFLQLF